MKKVLFLSDTIAGMGTDVTNNQPGCHSCNGSSSSVKFQDSVVVPPMGTYKWKEHIVNYPSPLVGWIHLFATRILAILLFKAYHVRSQSYSIDTHSRDASLHS